MAVMLMRVLALTLVFALTGCGDDRPEKIAKFQKYLRAPLDAEVVVSVERHIHSVDVTINADGQRYAAREESEDMYASIDLCLDKVDRQIRSKKAAAVDRKRH